MSVRGFHIRGIEPERNIYDFQIAVDASFADELRHLDVPEQQEPAADHIMGALTHDMADVRFVDDSFLLRGITVGFQATGLDLHNKELGRQTFATHNVDNSEEAIEVIAAFARWEDLAAHLIEEEYEDTATMVTSGNETCFCGGNEEWDYHSPEGCGATAQAAVMARSDFLEGDTDE